MATRAVSVESVALKTDWLGFWSLFEASKRDVFFFDRQCVQEKTDVRLVGSS